MNTIYNAHEESNFDRIKCVISEMTMEELIEFCGGDTCHNVICGHIPGKYAHCRNKRLYTCAECLREYLSDRAE